MLMVCINNVRALIGVYDIHTAWASVLLFGMEGNTRARVSGTATLQSRFLYVYVRTMNNIMEKY